MFSPHIGDPLDVLTIMENSTYKLSKDPRWAHSSFKRLKEKASWLTFGPSVPEDVVKRFHAVKMLVVHSFFEYEFLDVALDRAVITLELALTLRYRQMEEGRPPNLAGLIQWGAERNVFEDQLFVLDSYRDFRNQVTAHPQRYYLHGMMALGAIARIAMIVNDIFEPIEKRLERRKTIDRVNSTLRRWSENGVTLMAGESSTVLHHAELAEIDNRRIITVYDFVFCSIHPSRFEGGHMVEAPDPYQFSATHLEVSESALVFSSVRPLGVKCVLKATKGAQREEYLRWSQNITTTDSWVPSVMKMQAGQKRIAIRGHRRSKRKRGQNI